MGSNKLEGWGGGLKILGLGGTFAVGGSALHYMPWKSNVVFTFLNKEYNNKTNPANIYSGRV